LACHVVELQRQIKNKDNFLEEQRARLLEEEQQLSGAAADHLRLKDQVKQVRQEMRRLKKKYDSLLEESRLREERVRGQSLKHPVTCTLKDNRHRGPEAAVPIVKTSVTFVRTSVTSPRIFYPILKLFQKKRIHTGDVLEEDQAGSAGFCWSARVPVRALQVLEAHEQGINAVSFSSLDLLATGGTDKVIKLWDITSGSLSHRATLGGSTDGITCIDFSHMGDRILAASYDKSALLWQRGSVTPKLTLTGHSRKVTVARFCTLPHQVATGSTDRTIRHWDLHRAACVQVVQVTSYCSDLVCADHLIISGHYDCRIRVWDSRADGFSCGSDSTKAVISPDGGFLAAGSADGTLYIWNVSTGKMERHLPGKHISAISAVSWSPSGKYVVSVDKGGTAVLWSDHRSSSILFIIISLSSCVQLLIINAMVDKATRVFKKASPNGKLTVYLGKRDFMDQVDQVEPVDGVILIEPEYLKARKVFVTLTCAFRYGREDLDVLGLTFRKDLFVANSQVFPPSAEQETRLTLLQERLMKKLGEHAHPFTFQIPLNLPCSVTLQPGPEDTGKACGVDFEVKAFCAENLEEKIHKRNSVRLVIRKVQFAPEKPGPQPTAETTRQFLMSDKLLHLEASLDKETYYHGEPISVNVHVTNNTNKTVKKMKISVRQFADICLFTTAQYKCPVATEESDDVVAPSSTFCKVFTITPFLSNNREKRGLALDGKLRHEDTNLASSTLSVVM
ncbi:hypothetical protein fugu_010772, partial [Takifugu bimaculatus]